MAGHSKWATTKHKKAALDAKRAKMFAKHIKAIEVAARAGGPDLEGNPALDLAVSKAKKQSVPNDNIDRAIKRGAGLTGEVINYEEIIYEVRGPEGSALMVECLTDNKNRAAAEVRHTVTRNNGTLADSGSVAFLFNRQGVVRMDAEGKEEDEILMAVLDAGAEEVAKSGGSFEVYSDPSDLQDVAKALDEAEIDYESDEVEFVATMKVELDAKAARQFLRLADALEELDDVQNVSSNVDITDEVAAELENEDD
ncbi:MULTISPECIES: YebC/PmpR family DNA-binding transcriptional regulator [Auritidibacter]|uniref:Probable transcriptional regulatory protein QDX21_03735 n=1 Tax=Auritidibacter ignavus TaxID=678932 RepID=A0AAJ6AI65_9MICC|nr:MULTISPECIES: YebC/PmpR family DNA-binding transcriptional regulator [Auritidibacter]PXA75841.1 YebC/PmpR family DNA-binding transcriptional regulator [Auritidibacter sp. NML120779]AXR73655.1 YebC/PmpR family DNA-binding transcriptional regulator [Auritidibacter sp. NML130574]NIH70433.1 YebC/PmpR family DNA-binding regulatory protein [Auritidibacter ignavus]PXA75875.1 YebC/PmpR family DNA-binding transcriptional regulator [Auritidibacter sp. NML100628]PXA75905.1 YebC/PmpR family DNA-binding